MYAMCQIGSKSIVTLKMSEVLFKNPARNGDILEFWTRKSKVGRSSLGVECVVVRKKVRSPQAQPLAPKTDKEGKFNNPEDIILSCEFAFVHVNEEGKPAPHLLAN